MKYDQSLLEGKFLKRYKRFFADVLLDGQVVTAHVPNTGSLKGCLSPDIKCRLTYNNDPKRKLKYTLQMVKTPQSWVGINTALPNRLVWEAWEQKQVPHWGEFHEARREVKISSQSRIDLVLNPQADKKHYVEIKSVTLAEKDQALFPDSVTTRGQKHIHELMELIKKGHSAEMVFTVQRQDCEFFSVADAIDPDYGRLLRQAKKKGLLVSVYPCLLTSTEIKLETKKPLKVIL